MPVPTTKPPSRTRGIGAPVPLAQPTTTVSATTTPPTGTVATTTTTTRPKGTTTTSGVDGVYDDDRKHRPDDPVNYDNDGADNYHYGSFGDDHDERRYLDDDNQPLTRAFTVEARKAPRSWAIVCSASL